MKDIYFIIFHKEKLKLERWVRACCSREGFTANHVTMQTDFHCSRHFVGGKGPTTDPIPGNFCDSQVCSILERSDNMLFCFDKYQ